MQSKIKDKIIVFGFCIILAIVFIANILIKDQQISITERRKLEQFPEITVDKTTNPLTSNPTTNQNVVKQLDVTLTYKDALYKDSISMAGLRDDNVYTYYLSTSDSALDGGSLTTINPAPTGTADLKTATITIIDNLNILPKLMYYINYFFMESSKHVR